MKLYRYLTGPDDSAFCKRVSAASTRAGSSMARPR